MPRCRRRDGGGGGSSGSDEGRDERGGGSSGSEDEEEERLTLKNARAYRSQEEELYPHVRFLLPKSRCRRLNTRGARITGEACMHTRGDPTLTLELDLQQPMFWLVEEKKPTSSGWWVQLRSVHMLGHAGRRARVVLEVML